MELLELADGAIEAIGLFAADMLPIGQAPALVQIDGVLDGDRQELELGAVEPQNRPSV
jgi:hypothetical protein